MASKQRSKSTSFGQKNHFGLESSRGNVFPCHAQEVFPSSRSPRSSPSTAFQYDRSFPGLLELRSAERFGQILGIQNVALNLFKEIEMFNLRIRLKMAALTDLSAFLPKGCVCVCVWARAKLRTYSRANENTRLDNRYNYCKSILIDALP